MPQIMWPQKSSKYSFLAVQNSSIGDLANFYAFCKSAVTLNVLYNTWYGKALFAVQPKHLNMKALSLIQTDIFPKLNYSYCFYFLIEVLQVIPKLWNCGMMLEFLTFWENWSNFATRGCFLWDKIAETSDSVSDTFCNIWKDFFVWKVKRINRFKNI